MFLWQLHFGGEFLTFVPRIQLKSIKVCPPKVCIEIERNIQVIALKISTNPLIGKCHCSFLLFFLLRKSLMSWYQTQRSHKPQVAWSEIGSEGDLFDLFVKKKGQSKGELFYFTATKGTHNFWYSKPPMDICSSYINQQTWFSVFSKLKTAFHLHLFDRKMVLKSQVEY